MRVLAKIAVLPAIILGLAACSGNTAGMGGLPAAGGGGKDLPGKNTTDLCSVLTLERAKQLTGDDTVEKPADDQRGPDECEYKSEETNQFVKVRHERDPDGNSFKLGKEFGGVPKPVPGVGDDAYWQVGSTVLTARKSGATFTVSMLRMDGYDKNSSLEPFKQLINDMMTKVL